MARTRGALALAPGFVSVASAAGYTGLSSRTIWRLVKAGEIPTHRVGRRVLVRVADLDSMITGDERQSQR